MTHKRLRNALSTPSLSRNPPALIVCLRAVWFLWLSKIFVTVYCFWKRERLIVTCIVVGKRRNKASAIFVKKRCPVLTPWILRAPSTDSTCHASKKVHSAICVILHLLFVEAACSSVMKPLKMTNEWKSTVEFCVLVPLLWNDWKLS